MARKLLPQHRRAGMQQGPQHHCIRSHFSKVSKDIRTKEVRLRGTMRPLQPRHNKAQGLQEWHQLLVLHSRQDGQR